MMDFFRRIFTRQSLVPFLVGGLVYGIILQAFNYAENAEFDVWRFLFDVVFFGLLMAIISQWTKRDVKKERN